MTALPRVAEQTREKVSKEFDDVGPGVCVARISETLRHENPELLDMAAKCARDIGVPDKIMVGFCMFYRLLVLESGASHHEPTATVPLPSGLPRVAPETRDSIVQQIDEQGPEAFTRASLKNLERTNPELLQFAHQFASRQADYLRIMQGFALLYASLVAQSIADRARLN
jgi:hypothetical protein